MSADDAMMTFLATIDPLAVEQERLGPPPWDERPGGKEWRRMQAEHDLQVERWHAERARREARHQIALALAEGSRYDKRMRDREYADYLKQARARRRAEREHLEKGNAA